VRRERLELSTHGLENRCSIRLSYRRLRDLKVKYASHAYQELTMLAKKSLIKAKKPAKDSLTQAYCDLLSGIQLFRGGSSAG
jgi:hypothetical protein